MHSQLLSPKQLADRCGWPIGRIRSLIAKREIRHVRIGGSLLLPETAVDEYLASNMVEPELMHEHKTSLGNDTEGD